MLAAFGIVRSAEGDRRRASLATAVQALRGGLAARGLTVMGGPSPIVPVLIGRDDVARTAAKLAAEAGVLVNLVEYPAVSRNTARFRMQVMSTHAAAAAELAAGRIAESIRCAGATCSQSDPAA